MGLDHIFKLTNRNKTQLKIILERFSGEMEVVLYDDFYLEDQVNKANKLLFCTYLLEIKINEEKFRQNDCCGESNGTKAAKEVLHRAERMSLRRFLKQPGKVEKGEAAARVQEQDEATGMKPAGSENL